MRRKRAFLSMGASLLYQIIALLCGFIVQRILLGHYGSEIVGITASITKFLGFITLAEAGMGGVIIASLYKPLSNMNEAEISGILSSSNRFFRKIAYVFAVYIIILGIVFPRINNSIVLDNGYVFLLTVSIGLSSLMQYYFGMTNQLLLQADQKQYIPTALNIVTAILNTICVYLLACLNADILLVKLVSSFVFIIKPIVLFIYCKRNYKLAGMGSDSALLDKQKWAGIGHHLSYFVHSSTDVAILTILGRYGEIAVYSLYTMIAGNLTNIIDCASGGLQAAFGNILATDDQITLRKSFDVFETIIHICVTVVFGTAGIMVIPFMKLYTKGLTDIEYIMPVFSCICMIQEAAFCLRRPYVMIIAAAGHYKQTQWHGYAEAALNIGLSFALVGKYGITGLSIGTACAMFFRMFVSIFYLQGNILYRDVRPFFKCLICDIIALIPAIALYYYTKKYIEINSYLTWIAFAAGVFILLSICTLISYYFINRNVLRESINEMGNTIKEIQHKRNSH